MRVDIPISKIQRVENDNIVVLGRGRLGSTLQQIQLEFGPNLAPARGGVSHTEKSCRITLDQGLLKALAKHLSVMLPRSYRVKYHNFDFVEAEGTFLDMLQTPVTLEIIDLADSELYSEWYLEVNSLNRRIRLSEKNNQYREPFVKAFFN